MTKVLVQGAESKIYVGEYLGKPVIIKERFKKKYRNPKLDEFLTKERITSECRNIARCKTAGVRTPALYYIDFNENKIYMEYYDTAVTAKNFINNLHSMRNIEEEVKTTNLTNLARRIGRVLRRIHGCNIVHGDLTTSNMLLTGVEGPNFQELIVIDFGLSHSEASAEDKAVDLYVLERALSSTHKDTENIFKVVLESYLYNNKQGQEVINKLEEVRLRGRKRTMVG